MGYEAMKPILMHFILNHFFMNDVIGNLVNVLHHRFTRVVCAVCSNDKGLPFPGHNKH